MINKIVILFILLAIPVYVSAEPLPWGIAINSDTRQCTGFWGGDEFTEYELPSGWKDYYPTAGENNALIIQTQYGECNFIRGNYEECCNEMGLLYIEDPGIDCRVTDWAIEQGMIASNCKSSDVSSDNYQFDYSPIFIVIILFLILIAVLIWYFSKKKA